MSSDGKTIIFASDRNGGYGKMDLYEMILAGENNLVEFKTTMRYDMKTGTVNKRLEEVILKTIAAFSNAVGSTFSYSRQKRIE